MLFRYRENQKFFRSHIFKIKRTSIRPVVLDVVEKSDAGEAEAVAFRSIRPQFICAAVSLHNWLNCTSPRLLVPQQKHKFRSVLSQDVRSPAIKGNPSHTCYRYTRFDCARNLSREYL